MKTRDNKSKNVDFFSIHNVEKLYNSIDMLKYNNYKPVLCFRNDVRVTKSKILYNFTKIKVKHSKKNDFVLIR